MVGWNNPKPAPGRLALVQDFVNTRNYFQGGDLLGDAEEATRRLTECGLLEKGESVGEAERQGLVSFREALRGLLLAHNGAAEPRPDAEGLNSLVSSSALVVCFGADGRPVLEPATEDDPAERVVARLLAETVRAEAEGQVGTPEGLPQRGVSLGLLRRLQERHGTLVQHAGLRSETQDAHLS